MIATGILTIRNKKRWKRFHRLAALLTLTLTLITAATGVAMVLLATPL